MTSFYWKESFNLHNQLSRKSNFINRNIFICEIHTLGKGTRLHCLMSSKYSCPCRSEFNRFFRSRDCHSENFLSWKNLSLEFPECPHRSCITSEYNKCSASIKKFLNSRSSIAQYFFWCLVSKRAMLIISKINVRPLRM